MPLPFILGAAAAIAGVTGVGNAIHGGVKMKRANDTMKLANERHKNKKIFWRNETKTWDSTGITA